MPKVRIGTDWELEDDGTNLYIRHTSTGNEWEFAPNGDLDLPADLTGRVDRTIYDATAEEMSAPLADGLVNIDPGPDFYPSRRV